MEKTVKIEVSGADGNNHPCVLIEKLNNQNGQMLYTFRNERTGYDFLISKDGANWRHVQGEMPNPDCVKELGDYIDNLDKGQ